MIQFLNRFIIYLFALIGIFAAFADAARPRMNDGLAMLAQHWLYYTVCAALWLLMFECIYRGFTWTRRYHSIENAPTAQLDAPETRPLPKP